MWHNIKTNFQKFNLKCHSNYFKCTLLFLIYAVSKLYETNENRHFYFPLSSKVLGSCWKHCVILKSRHGWVHVYRVSCDCKLRNRNTMIQIHSEAFFPAFWLSRKVSLWTRPKQNSIPLKCLLNVYEIKSLGYKNQCSAIPLRKIPLWQQRRCHFDVGSRRFNTPSRLDKRWK